MKHYQCSQCHFTTKEPNKQCPLCYEKIQEIDQEEITYHVTLPDFIENYHTDIYMGYFCLKCRKRVRNRVCLECNNLSALTLVYNNKRFVVHQNQSLYDDFTKDEVNEIIGLLSDEEKHLIYHHFAHSDRFFYRRDSMKMAVSIFTGVLMYVLSLMITVGDSETETVFISYFSNAFGNGIFLFFVFLGIWYWFKPSEVEKTQLPLETAICVGVFSILFLLLAIINGFDFQQVIQYGFLFLPITALGYAAYVFLWRRKR